MQGAFLVFYNCVKAPKYKHGFGLPSVDFFRLIPGMIGLCHAGYIKNISCPAPSGTFR